MANKKMNPTNLPWFPMYTAAWLGSDTVQSMTYTERGIYHELMAMCWQYGSIPWDKSKLAKKLRIDPRVCGRFMDRYADLTQTLHEGYTEVTLPKLQEFAETLAKNAPPSDTEERRGNKREMRREQKPSVPVVSVTKTGTDAPVKPKGFDPLTYLEPVKSTGKGEALEYPSEDVHRTLLYHFKYHPSDFWTDKVSSSADVARHINTMHTQMVRDAGEDWTPPEVKQALTRIAGDPSCAKCRGRGTVSKRMEDGITRYQEDCTCEKHQQVAKGREWVDS